MEIPNDMIHEVSERLASAETKLEAIQKDLADTKTDVKALTLALSKYQGFWGGFVLVVGAVWILFQFGWEHFKAKALG